MPKANNFSIWHRLILLLSLFDPSISPLFGRRLCHIAISGHLAPHPQSAEHFAEAVASLFWLGYLESTQPEFIPEIIGPILLPKNWFST